MRSLTDPPPASARARFDTSFGQRFLLTVDTEEEFDWSGPFTRDQHGLEHLPELERFQRFCEVEGVVPVYLVDWPVANSPVATKILKPCLDAGKAEIGIQLHPWVNPPFEEQVSAHTSYAGNLPPQQEEAKFAALKSAIESNFGAKPLIYRAGRYGLGPASAELLVRHGILIDSSVRSKFDYSSGGGPDYACHPLEPYWADDSKHLLELPLTSTFWGMLRQQGNWIYPRMRDHPGILGALARIGMIERIPLTPEGVSVEEAIRGIDMALDDGLPLLIISFHSPSLQAGHTPYVRSEKHVGDLYDWFERIFSYLRLRGVGPTTVADILGSAQR